MESLGRLWAKALLMAKMSPEEGQAWAEKLQRWIQEIVVGSILVVALLAAQQGWDDSSLVAILLGQPMEPKETEEKRNFLRPSPGKALIRIRLVILERRGRNREYLHLAWAAGEYRLYRLKLVELGQCGRAVEAARDWLTEPDALLEATQAL